MWRRQPAKSCHIPRGLVHQAKHVQNQKDACLQEDSYFGLSNTSGITTSGLELHSRRVPAAMASAIKTQILWD